MDHTDDFSTNWRIQSNEDISLDAASLAASIEKHGLEQTIGYLRAVRHFEMELQFAVYDLRPDAGNGTRPLTRISNNVKKLLNHKRDLLESTTAKLIMNSEDRPSIS